MATEFMYMLGQRDREEVTQSHLGGILFAIVISHLQDIRNCLSSSACISFLMGLSGILGNIPFLLRVRMGGTEWSNYM